MVDLIKKLLGVSGYLSLAPSYHVVGLPEFLRLDGWDQIQCV